MPKTKTTTVKREIKAKLTNKLRLRTDVLDMDGQIIDKIDLPEEIFAVKINPVLMAQAVRVYLANQRQGTLSTKTRGEVAGSTRKIYKQKGTGRARHGSIKAPIFVGGGIIFGPKPRDFSLKLSQQMKKQALLSSLSNSFKSNNIILVNIPQTLTPKTKTIMDFLSKIKLKPINHHLNLKILLVSEANSSLWRACRNIANLTMISPNLLNTYQVLLSQKIILTPQAIQQMNKVKEIAN